MWWKKPRRGSDEPKRVIHHTEDGVHWVDGREILQSERARKLIAQVALELKVWRPGE